ncbi:MAG TPA: hypothetical protein VE860_20425 [Chthoniobacterales bacterium]|jgi:hypothetical protein|nr:hypothetical protein [Chthoniobacterales bacterium]
MANEKVYVQFSSNTPPVEGVAVDVVSSSEPWGDVTLSDGAKLRVKTVILSVARVDSHKDPEGNPVYFIKSQPVIAMIKPPEGQP